LERMQGNQEVDVTRQDYLNDHNIALGAEHPRRMFLERADRDSAYDLRAEIEKNQPELENLNDFWYAQLSLISESLVEAGVYDHVVQEGVRRATGLQHFRAEYGILNTYEDGCRRLRELVDSLLPDLLIHFGFSEDTNTYLVVVDLAKFQTTSFTKQQTEAFCAPTYYLLQALNCDFTSIRMGHSFLVECQGVDFDHKQHFSAAKSLFSHLGDLYPINVLEIKYFHAGVFMLKITSDFKRLMPDILRRQDQLAFEAAGHHHLSEFTWETEPSTEAAILSTPNRYHTNIQNIQAALKIRYHNERTYALEPIE
jgi:hypothetical protein